jgi:hypothetical protein
MGTGEKHLVSEALPTTRDDQGRVLTRSGICTGFMVGGIEYGVMAPDKDAMRLLARALHADFDLRNCKTAVWVRQSHYDEMASRPTPTATK